MVTTPTKSPALPSRVSPRKVANQITKLKKQMKLNFSPVMSTSGLDPRDDKFREVIRLAAEGTQLSYSLEDEVRIGELKKLEDEAARTFKWQLAATLQREKVGLKAGVAKPKEKVTWAIQILEESRICFNQSITIKNYDLCEEWKTITIAASTVLRDHLVAVDEADAHVQETARTSRKRKNAPEVAITPESTVGDSAASPMTPVMVHTKGGTMAPLDETLDAAEPHHQARKRKVGAGTSSKKQKAQAISGPKPITTSAFKSFLELKWTFTRTNDAVVLEGTDKKGHRLELKEGLIFCFLCNTGKCMAKSAVTQHLAGKKHQDNWANMKKRSGTSTVQQESLDDTTRLCEERRSKHGHLTAKMKAYRVTALRGAYQSNISLCQLGRLDKAFIGAFRQPDVSLGHADDLAKEYGGLLREQEMNKLRDRLKKCYPQFATISDGTPTFAKAEAMMIRLVTHDLQIVQILVNLKLFKHGLTGENIANSMLHTIRKVLQLPPHDWRFAMMDRAASNIKAIKDIKRTTEYTPAFVPCCSHTLCKPGESFASRRIDAIRKTWNTAIMFKGRASDTFKKVFNVSVRRAGGVRWWVQYEQMEQLDDVGLGNVMTQVVPECIRHKWSPESMKSLQKLASPERLPLATVELSAVVEAGLPFCQATYMLEGDDPLILTAYIVFQKLDRLVDNGFALPNTREKCKRAAAEIKRLKQPLIEAIDLIKEEIDQIIEHIGRLESAPTESPTTATETPLVVAERRSHRAKTTVQNYDLTANGNYRRRRVPQLGQMRDEGWLEEQLLKLHKELDVLEVELAESYVELEDLIMEIGPATTEEELYAHARDVVVAPAIQKYAKLFHHSGGHNDDPNECIPDLVRTKLSSEACKLFDPFYIASVTQDSLEILADNLKYFDIPEFNEAFIMELKKEIPKALQDAKKTFDWDSIPEAKTYKRRVNERARRRNQQAIVEEGNPEAPLVNQSGYQPDDNNTASTTTSSPQDSWKEDPGERARRIWEWWRIRLNADKSSWKMFHHALRLIVLSQVSSAAVERVFSQLMYIIKTCGVSMLEDTVEMRAMIRCNDGLESVFE
jgi:hypothetical protein